MLVTLANTITTSFHHHALHGGDAVSRSMLRLYGVSTIFFGIFRFTKNIVTSS